MFFFGKVAIHIFSVFYFCGLLKQKYVCHCKSEIYHVNNELRTGVSETRVFRSQEVLIWKEEDIETFFSGTEQFSNELRYFSFVCLSRGHLSAVCK